MSQSSIELGRRGEKAAVQFLKEKGFQIKTLNYRSGRGELDIIALDGDITVFVEVKARWDLNMGDPAYGVTTAKIKQLKKIAELYLYDHGIDEIDCRFDVVTVLFGTGDKPIIEHYVDAFD